jgi:uncharacterized protein (TIGR00369 family)
MTFRLVDEILSRQVAGEARSPAADRLDLRFVWFARGVAVFEMPLRSEVCDPTGAVPGGLVATLAEAAMKAAATSALPDDRGGSPALVTRHLSARFERAVGVGDADLLRAEAVVMRVGRDAVHVEAEVLAEGVRVAAFESSHQPEASVQAPERIQLPVQPAGVA